MFVIHQRKVGMGVGFFIVMMKFHCCREGMGSQNPTNSERLRTSWTLPMERYFIDLMLDQVHRGNRMGHTFNKQAWNDMLIMFNANFGSPYDVNILKSHYTSLWKQFNDIKNLLDQNGFSWDNTRQMVIADRYAWDAYVKVHYLAYIYLGMSSNL